jgi:hypothetical protein
MTESSRDSRERNRIVSALKAGPPYKVQAVMFGKWRDEHLSGEPPLRYSEAGLALNDICRHGVLGHTYRVVTEDGTEVYQLKLQAPPPPSGVAPGSPAAEAADRIQKSIDELDADRWSDVAAKRLTRDGMVRARNAVLGTPQVQVPPYDVEVLVESFGPTKIERFVRRGTGKVELRVSLPDGKIMTVNSLMWEIRNPDGPREGSWSE